MVAVETNINVTQVIQSTNKDTGEKEYYILKEKNDTNWIKISESQYNEILRGNDDG